MNSTSSDLLKVVPVNKLVFLIQLSFKVKFLYTTSNIVRRTHFLHMNKLQGLGHKASASQDLLFTSQLTSIPNDAAW